jgi:proline racemase
LLDREVESIDTNLFGGLPIAIAYGGDDYAMVDAEAIGLCPSLDNDGKIIGGGTGTSAHLALLFAKGDIGEKEVRSFEGITGTCFDSESRGERAAVGNAESEGASLCYCVPPVYTRRVRLLPQRVSCGSAAAQVASGYSVRIHIKP